MDEANLLPPFRKKRFRQISGTPNLKSGIPEHAAGILVSPHAQRVVTSIQCVDMMNNLTDVY